MPKAVEVHVQIKCQCGEILKARRENGDKVNSYTIIVSPHMCSKVIKKDAPVNRISGMLDNMDRSADKALEELKNETDRLGYNGN